MELLAEFIYYNILISPKPTWEPGSSYTFEYDVQAIWQDMLKQIHLVNREQRWGNLALNVRSRLARLLTREYLEKRRGPVTYTVGNPWFIPPAEKSSDWLLSSRSKHCVPTKIETVKVQ